MPETDRDRREHIKHIQEWLCLHDFGVVIDGELGLATKLALQRFQRAHDLAATGTDDQQTIGALTKPIRDVQSLRLPVYKMSYSATVAFCAAQHLREHPREVGGQNRGPWVRLYMDGREGDPWCAGFVTYIIKQAAELLKIEPPIAGSVSSALLAGQAKAAHLQVNCATKPPPGSIMLVKGGAHGYNHCGIVVSSGADTFETIEGNTNDSGSAEGYEVCKRTRSYGGKEFIVWRG
jgi:hypothetical protein